MTVTKERDLLGGKTVDLQWLAATALGVEAPSRIFINDICEDSRRVRPGALFVAVRGSKADGAGYVADAVSHGAAAVVMDRSAQVQTAVPLIRVDDPRRAVARLAAVFYGMADLQAAGKMTVVGVTGTNGKSTIAFMLRHLLRCAGHTTAMFGTIEYDLVSRKLASDLTTPDAVTLTKHLLEAHGAGANHAVMEVSSHSLDQRRTDGIVFSTAVFTNLTQDHLDYHGTRENYLLAKRRLFDGLSADATAIVNAHDPVSARLIEHCNARVVRFGLASELRGAAPGSAVVGTILREDRSGGRFLLEYKGRQIEIRTPMAGRYNIFNALAAAAAGFSLGLDLPTIQRGLAELNHVPGRLQRVPTDELGFDVFVDYAHTDDALRNVLAALRPLTSGRLWCVFGCGGDRDRTKRPKMARAVAEGADAFVMTSDNPRNEDPLAILADIERGLSAEDAQHGVTMPDRREAIEHAVKRLSPGDCLVIAGKGHEDYQIVGAHKNHFDDVEVAAEAIARRQVTRVCVP